MKKKKKNTPQNISFEEIYEFNHSPLLNIFVRTRVKQFFKQQEQQLSYIEILRVSSRNETMISIR